MKRMIEVKHVGPREQVRTLIEGLVDRLEDRLQHFRQDAVSVHVLFDQNGTRTLYRASLSCHVPRHMIAAREESRNPGTAIRKAFKEIERQVERQCSRIHPRALSRRRAEIVPQVDGLL